MKKEIRSAYKWLLLPISAVGVAFLLNFVFFINAYIPSGSMESTVPEGSLVIGSRLSYIKNAPKVGDVVFFESDELSRLLIKRVVATEGQTVKIENGILYVDGRAVQEKYCSSLPEKDFPEVTVPLGNLFMLGDNRAASNDSRYWEEPFISIDKVVGKALYVYFPKLARIN